MAVSSLLGGALSSSAETYGLFVSGLGGDQEIERSFYEATRLLFESAIASGMKESNLVWLSEDTAVDDRTKERSTREAVLNEIGLLSTRLQTGDLLWMVIVGHGSYRDGQSKVNLPGPDLSDRDLVSALSKIPKDRALVFVHTGSASGGFLEALSAEGRVVITATKSPAQRNSTVFGTFFAAAFAEARADSDQDGFVSALEGFQFAAAEVERYYGDQNLLVTENALLDDNGDRIGSLAPSRLGGDSGKDDGAVSARMVLGASALTGVVRTAENAVFLDRKLELQRSLDSLRRQKAALEETLYLAELQRILVEMAKIDRQLRTLSSPSKASPPTTSEHPPSGTLAGAEGEPRR